MEARHVEETAKGMRIKYPPAEAKTNKERVIYVAAEVADLIRERVKKHPTGRLFRNKSGRDWTSATLKRAFDLARKRANKQHGGELIDAKAVMYSARHTFAKRTLSGYYTGGKGCTIEALSKLMGNTPKICYEHYADWCEMYTEPLWAALG